LDGLLTFCVTTSVLCGFEAVRTGSLRRSWWIAAALFSGLGFLTKGPISEILLFPPLMMFAWLARGTARITFRHALLFGVIVFAVNLPWYLAIYLKQPEFLKYFFWEHNVMRFVKPFDHLEPVWYYVPILLGGFLPGLVFLVPYLFGLAFGHPTANAARSRSGGFWLVAGLWCVFFFSFSGSKLPTYILPAYPFLCLALGEFIARTHWDTRWLTRGVIVVAALFLAGVNYVGLPWYARVRSPMVHAEIVKKYVANHNVVVVTHPRNCDSVAFYLNRSDLKQVRSKDMNQMIVDSHFREKTVILFTHHHSLEAFRETLRTAVGSSVGIIEEVDLSYRATGIRWIDRMLGNGSWGLCDLAVIAPNQREPRPAPEPAATAK
jgi:4-amino-4-deoxy-L-arabinose transferase-like glycosyltransferase